MNRDFLADLDAAIAGLCACGCGTVITAASPSAWFSSEACSTRWHGGVRSALEDLLARVVDEIRARFADLADVVSALFEEAVRRARAIVDTLGPYCDVLDYSTPAPRVRPPARIDPGTGITAHPNGRPAFRPRY